MTLFKFVVLKYFWRKCK